VLSGTRPAWLAEEHNERCDVVSAGAGRAHGLVYEPARALLRAPAGADACVHNAVDDALVAERAEQAVAAEDHNRARASPNSLTTRRPGANCTACRIT
jgi:hypothetical protein